MLTFLDTPNNNSRFVCTLWLKCNANLGHLILPKRLKNSLFVNESHISFILATICGIKYATALNSPFELQFYIEMWGYFLCFWALHFIRTTIFNFTMYCSTVQYVYTYMWPFVRCCGAVVAAADAAAGCPTL